MTHTATAASLFEATKYELLLGDCIATMKTLPANSVQCVVTSPPYLNLRSYLPDGHPDKHLEIGGEQSVAEYVGRLVEVFREVRRVLREDGVLFLNLGDSYNGSGGAGGDYGPGGLKEGQPKYAGSRMAGLKPKDLIGVPWECAFALRADGWWLRQELIWHKKAPMPESVTDRCTKAHEQVFLLTKSAQYYFDADAIREENAGVMPYGDKRNFKMNDEGAQGRHGKNSMFAGGTRDEYIEKYYTNGRNKRSVWTLGPESFSGTLRTSRRVPVERHAVSDGTNCKVSPDCPVHADLFDWAATDSYDVRVGDLLSRTSRTHVRHVPSQRSGSVPTDQLPGVATVAENSDSLHLPHSLFATDHSNGNHKTAHDLATNPPYNACDETLDRIDGRQVSPDFDTPNQHIPLSNTVAGDSVSSEVSPPLYRNVDSEILSVSYVASSIPPECMCTFYHTITEKTSHFATMPTKLVEPCILAGTSAHGCCAVCGAPWARVVERTAMEVRPGPTREARGENGRLRTQVNGTMTKPPISTTTGWMPSCACNADVVPCTVLDPFLGSGTTLAVALKHGRRGIGCELNESYISLAHDRISRSQPLLFEVHA